MHLEPFPYLKHLLGGYFHQDCYDDGDSDEDIMREFRRTTWSYEQLGARADIQRMLHQHGDYLLEAMQQAFTPDIILGQTNEEARSWLLEIDALLTAG